jgi:hypothetical protein
MSIADVTLVRASATGRFLVAEAAESTAYLCTRNAGRVHCSKDSHTHETAIDISLDVRQAYIVFGKRMRGGPRAGLPPARRRRTPSTTRVH